ncbi:hypothetical protein DAPPUDRAFT_311388 [Daphnia pulex]|uniref:Cytochrome P450 n=1 Tax=Daphnia pulex TaxID=6669 RepID=E9FWR8_DAPPU|nr:hypothetical protein DAPPUDRAFT_311388 [Daphnia pulex]|eukprot:EFX88386.1 hypothetical protein DAPPUDRAFT_311388 [Daphnia pulex]
MELPLENSSPVVVIVLSFLFPFLIIPIGRFVISFWRFRVLINRLPQGPRPFPIVGNAYPLMGRFDCLLQMLQVDWQRTYGEIYCTYMGSICTINISSPELLEPILKSQKLMHKGATYKFFEPWLGDGLLLSTGAKWKMRRHLMTPSFHFQILNTFIEVFNKQSLILCDVLDKRRQSQQEDEIINVYPFVANCTLDIICEAAMGVSVNAQYQRSEYVKAIYRINQIIMERFSKPWLVNDFIFKFTPQGREQSCLLKTLHSFTRNVIENRRELLAKMQNEMANDGQDVETAPGNRRPLLDTLLGAKSSDGTNVGLADKEIQEEIDTFMFEGHDTTASAVSWFLYCMAANPECQERAWTELQNVFGESDRECSQQDLSEFVYLECCLKECLRLYSSAPHIERYVKEEFQLGEYLIPAGCTLILRVHPDPWTFDPDRFLPERLQGRHPYAYIPFSAGPRNCIGQRFAMMEIKIIVSTLLRRFKFTLSPLSANPVPSMQSVLKPVDGQINLLISAR